MGAIQSTINYLISKFFNKEFTRICILGPLQSGKTSLLFHFNENQHIKTLPTIGFNVEEVRYKKKNFILYDIGNSLFSKWGEFILECEFIFFVIDVSSKESISNSKKLLYQIYFGERFRNLIKEDKEYDEQKLYLRDEGYTYSEEEYHDQDEYDAFDEIIKIDKNNPNKYKDETYILSEKYYRSVLIEQSESDTNIIFESDENEGDINIFENKKNKNKIYSEESENENEVNG